LQQPKSPGKLARAACGNKNHMGYWPVQLAATKITWGIGSCSLQQAKAQGKLARAACSMKNHLNYSQITAFIDEYTTKSI
jgi:hypothetical protein